MSGHGTPRSEAPLTGHCHCGNLELALETSVRPEELSLRADTCSFCRKHGARTTSDPSGRGDHRLEAVSPGRRLAQ